MNSYPNRWMPALASALSLVLLPWMLAYAAGAANYVVDVVVMGNISAVYTIPVEAALVWLATNWFGYVIGQIVMIGLCISVICPSSVEREAAQ